MLTQPWAKCTRVAVSVTTCSSTSMMEFFAKISALSESISMPARICAQTRKLGLPMPVFLQGVLLVCSYGQGMQKGMQNFIDLDHQCDRAKCRCRGAREGEGTPETFWHTQKAVRDTGPPRQSSCSSNLLARAREQHPSQAKPAPRMHRTPGSARRNDEVLSKVSRPVHQESYTTSAGKKDTSPTAITTVLSESISLPARSCDFLTHLKRPNSA